MTKLLVIMGSGETAPTMVTPHQQIFRRVPADAPAVLLDTPYGFQENADDISARAVGYFAHNVGRPVDVLSWRGRPEPGLGRERPLARLRAAGWAFAGPGSPTYALRQWRDTPVPAAFAAVDVLVFASAAACTLGSHAVPVYEIYKAGYDPFWEPGLDLVRELTGLPAVVIPHYDNSEGGHHDTRYCYLGERRLSGLEAELPADSFVLGVDEHTACALDLDAGTATVLGNGRVTVRRHGESVVYPAGSTVALDQLAAGGAPVARPRTAAPTATAEPAAAVPDSLRAAADRCGSAFDTALAARDVDGCVTAVLDLEQALAAWSADTLTSDEGDHARTVLRGMLTRLGDLARVGARDPRDVAGPYVRALLDVRTAARERRDFATSDLIRERLGALGVEVRDTADGAEWLLT